MNEQFSGQHDHYDCDTNLESYIRNALCRLHIWNSKAEAKVPCLGCQVEEIRFQKEYPVIVPMKQFHRTDF